MKKSLVELKNDNGKIIYKLKNIVMKNIKKFEDFKLNEGKYAYLDRYIQSEKIMDSLLKNRITGGNGFEDGAVSFPNLKKFEVGNVYWGKDKDAVSERMYPVQADWMYVQIFEDKMSFNPEDNYNLVCIVIDEDKEDVGCFFVKDSRDVDESEGLKYEYKYLKY